eukprot:GHVN01061805.1.p1 GENE.GHVN01061805.1~~GHVN01061805.1.p1  ORF type:complete len:118 (-),score=33.35 GHVN01061805.1:130-459(-)
MIMRVKLTCTDEMLGVIITHSRTSFVVLYTGALESLSLSRKSITSLTSLKSLTQPSHLDQSRVHSLSQSIHLSVCGVWGVWGLGCVGRVMIYDLGVLIYGCVAVGGLCV